MRTSLILYLQRSYVTVNDSLKMHRQSDLRRERGEKIWSIREKENRNEKSKGRNGKHL